MLLLSLVIILLIPFYLNNTAYHHHPYKSTQTAIYRQVRAYTTFREVEVYAMYSTLHHYKFHFAKFLLTAIFNFSGS